MILSERTRITLAAALCLLALLPGLGRQVMERQQELRVALVARDMGEGGSWLVVVSSCCRLTVCAA